MTDAAAAPPSGHDLHFERVSWCGQCRAERETEAAEMERERDTRIGENVAGLVTAAQDAYTAVDKVAGIVGQLVADYDVEIVEGSDQGDLERELETARRALRHVERIAKLRASLEA